MTVGILIETLSSNTIDGINKKADPLTFDFKMESSCCSSNLQQKRVTYHPPKGADNPDSPGGSLSINQECCLVNFFKSCGCCHANPPLSKEEENAIANKIFLNYLIEEYGLAPALAALAESTKKKDRNSHDPQQNPNAPLRVRHINDLHGRAQKMKIMVAPFYQLLKQQMAHTNVILPNSLRRPFSASALIPPSPKDCLALIQAINKNEITFQNEEIEC